VIEGHQICQAQIAGMVVFSRNGGVGWVVGLDDLRGLFQPMIL